MTCHTLPDESRETLDLIWRRRTCDMAVAGLAESLDRDCDEPIVRLPQRVENEAEVVTNARKAQRGSE